LLADHINGRAYASAVSICLLSVCNICTVDKRCVLEQ